MQGEINGDGEWGLRRAGELGHYIRQFVRTRSSRVSDNVIETKKGNHNENVINVN